MKKIALIDDNQDMISTIIYSIEDIDKNLKIIGFTNPKKFEEDTKKNKYDLILLDIMMPKLNGWDLFSIIKNSENKNKDTPIIFLTAKVDEQSIKLGRYASDSYITKPFETKDLVKEIYKYLK
ncbi:chemotaxis protein CheY [Candidatus Woesearchaeota archaeon]|nr:MAG: chemotaxis protein CheY [Candidatus Woesearchaeota archaeon]